MFPVASGRIDRIAVRFHNRSGATATVKAELFASRVPGVFDGVLLTAAECSVPAGENVTGIFRFNADVPGESAFILLDPVPGVSVLTRNRHLPGVYCKPDGCYFTNDNFCFAVTPEQRVFAPEQVSGTPPRPGLSANAWISDPDAGFPQTLELDCGAAAEYSRVELVFDTNLDKKNRCGAAPECVRDYRLEIRCADTWRTVAEVRGNYRRIRRHEFARQRISAFRLTVFAANGDPSARLYNFRVG